MHLPQQGCGQPRCTRDGDLSRAATDADRPHRRPVSATEEGSRGELGCTLPLERNTMATCLHLFLGGISMEFKSRTPHWSWYYTVGIGADHKTDQSECA
jgi:hypothetical protein